MKHLKRFDEAFGQNGMFDWEVADMKHTPSPRSNKSLNEVEMILSKDQDFEDVKRLLRTDKKANILNFTHWSSGQPLGSNRGHLITMFFSNTIEEVANFIQRNDIKIANKSYFGLHESLAQLGLNKYSDDKENQKGTFKYFMSLSNDELKDYQKNFTHHGFENPAEHNPEYVAWKTACEIKKVFSK